MIEQDKLDPKTFTKVWDGNDFLNKRINKYIKEVQIRTEEILADIIERNGYSDDDIIQIGRVESSLWADIRLPNVERFFMGDKCILEVTRVYENDQLKATWHLP